MRNYIRHPTNIPICIESGSPAASAAKVRNLSHGGICFTTEEQLKVGTLVEMQIPYISPEYKGSGVVVWRKEHMPTGFDVGVKFTSEDEFFRLRMVEQVCRIEAYRNIMCERGRMLTSEEAAQEWISRFAKDFDQEGSELEMRMAVDEASC